jgi:hypothetical protein
VGDVVTNDDDSEAAIVDGARFAATWDDKSFTRVGNRLSSGDTITRILQGGGGIAVRDDESIPGQFDPACTPPPTLIMRGARNHA